MQKATLGVGVAEGTMGKTTSCWLYIQSRCVIAVRTVGGMLKSVWQRLQVQHSSRGLRDPVAATATQHQLSHTVDPAC
jgi:hypothetical protein